MREQVLESEVHIYRLLHKWKFNPKVPRKRFVNAANKEREQFKKKAKEIISHIPKDFTIADALVRRRNGRGSLENYCCLQTEQLDMAAQL